MAVAKACVEILEEHISNQWRWPRESDVVSSLVGKIHNSLKEKYATPRVSGTRIKGAQIPRVRTEVKIMGKPWKIDVSLQTEGENDVFFGRGGPRDVLLRVDQSQIEEIVEVKLNPGRLYTDWVDDLIKLQNIREEVCDGPGPKKLKSLHGLFIDTSLPLCSVFESANERGLSKAKRVPVWPLEVVGDSICFEYPRADQTWQITLTNRTGAESDSDSGPHIYLWAVGFKAGATPIHEPACWKVEIAKKTDVQRP